MCSSDLERTTFRGEFFNIDEFVLKPAGTYRLRPRIYMGGESQPARNLAAAEADVLFLNGQPAEPALELIADVRRRPRPRSSVVGNALSEAGTGCGLNGTKAYSKAPPPSAMISTSIDTGEMPEPW